MSVYPFWRKLLAPVGKLLFRLRIEGTENIPKQGPVILCSNHRSVLDPFFMAVAVPRTIRFMAKSELFADHGRFARWLLVRLWRISRPKGQGGCGVGADGGSHFAGRRCGWDFSAGPLCVR